MKTMTFAAIAAITLAIAAPVSALESSGSGLCGPDAPEGYKRPGGYCETVGNLDSMVKSDKLGAGKTYAEGDGSEDPVVVVIDPWYQNI